MGIRVHKVIGYGLTDLKCDKAQYNKIIDPRINPDGFLGGDWERKENDYSKRGYVKFLTDLYESIQDTDKKDEDLTPEENALRWDKFNVKWELNWFKDGSLCKHLKTWQPYQSVIHQSEYGLPNVLLICPPEQLPTWSRYDHTIDYYEETLNHRQHNRIQLLPYGAYPYEGTYMDRRDGRKIKDGCEYKRLMRYMKEKGARDRAAQAMGFTNIAQAKRCMTPSIPNSVTFLARYLKLFKKDTTIWRLKPMIYVYWS